MNPKIWGASAWIFLHNIAYGYPTTPSKEEQNAAIDFLNSLQYMLPCKTCSELYKKDLILLEKELPLKKAVENKNNLIRWMNMMHNKVNLHLNKKTFTDDEYEKYYLNSDKNEKSYLVILLILIFIVIIFYIIFF